MFKKIFKIDTKKKFLYPFLLMSSKNVLAQDFPSILTEQENFENHVTKAKTFDDSPARSYLLNATTWFDNKTINYKTKKPIQQLMKRYAITGKKILSIGSGDGSVEEIWFIQDETNTIALFDLDENNVIETKIKSLSMNNEKKGPFFHFFVGDFMNNKNQHIGSYDVVYMSSFTPHEIRRGAISQAFLNLTGAQKQNIKTFEQPFGASDTAWPSWKYPFEHTILKETVKLLNLKGLFIYQSYCCGIDGIANKMYVQKTIDQLKLNGLITLDIHCIEESPGIQLIAAFKGTEKEARDFYYSIKKDDIITDFHGRANLPKKTIKVLYSLN